MAGGAPFDFVNPEWITTSNTGAHFDDDGFGNGAVHTNPLQQQHQPPLPPPFTPYGLPQSPIRTTYAALRQPLRNPVLTRSPTHRPLNPAARPFTPPRQSPPKETPSALRVETNIPQEHAVAATTPRTPRIQVTPVDDAGNILNGEAIQAARQLSRGRRSSSPGQRPTGVRRVSERRSLGTPTPMSRVVSAPGAFMPAVEEAGMSAYAMQVAGRNQRDAYLAASRAVQLGGNAFMQSPPVTDTQMSRVASLAPVQPMHPADWLTGTHNVGFDQLVHASQPVGSVAHQTPRSAPSRSRASSSGSHTRRPIVCDYPGCRHRAQGKVFKSEADFRKHQRNHLPESERPHGCPVLGCTRRFIWPKDVERHVDVVHNKTKAKCELCGAEVCRGDDLARHLATVHKGRITDPSNYAAASPSASSVASFANTPRSEYSFNMLSTPLTGPSMAFASASRPKGPPHLVSFESIPEYDLGSVPMEKSLTR